MRLVIVSYYDLRESLLCASIELQKLGYQVTNYPLLEKKSNNTNDYVQDMIHSLSIINPQFILWWFIGIPFKDLKIICDNFVNAKHLLFNWDDPYVWSDPVNEMPQKSSLFDIAFISCEDSIKLYEKYSNGKCHAVYQLPGHSLGIHYYTLREQVPQKYHSDISICCTNLYSDTLMYPNQLKPTRLEIVNALSQYCQSSMSNEDNIDFAIYGPEYLRDLYPHNYRFQVPYNETRYVFAGSYINICTHVISKVSARNEVPENLVLLSENLVPKSVLLPENLVSFGSHGYLSERVPLVLGSGGLLWMDKVPQDLISDKECIFIENNVEIINQVKQILQIQKTNPQKLQQMRRHGHDLAVSKMTWGHWAKTIDDSIRLYQSTIITKMIPDNFDHVAYKYINFGNYTSDELQSRQNCWNHYCQMNNNTLMYCKQDTNKESCQLQQSHTLMSFNDMKIMLMLHDIDSSSNKLRALKGSTDTMSTDTISTLMQLYWRFKLLK